MIRKVALAAFAAAIFSSGAVAAEYYVVQEKATKKCKVVETSVVLAVALFTFNALVPDA
jgi:hypothetical protein